MKKFYTYLLAAVALVGFAACSTDDTTESTTPDISTKRYISANIGNDATRVSFGEETEVGKLPILWGSTDYIYGQLVYPSTTTEGYSDIKEFTCTIADGVGTKSATFEFQGYSEGILTAYWFIPEGIYITAGKPYNIYLKWNEEKQAVVVTSSIDTWDVLGDANNINDQHIAHAYVATEEELLNSGIQVNNLACYLKFQVEKECSEIVFTSNNQFHGLIEYTVNGNEVLEVTGCYTNDEDKAKSSTLTLTPNEGGKFDPANVYYMTIIPGDHQFTVNIDGHLSKAASKAMTLKPNTIYNLGTLPAPSTPETPEPSNGFKIYAYSEDGWTNMNLYGWITYDPITASWPGTTMSVEEVNGLDFFVAQIPAEYNNVTINIIFNNGSEQTNDITGVVVDKDLYFAVKGSSATIIDPATYSPPTKLYLKPGVWAVDSPRYEAYFFGNGEKWVTMTQSSVSGCYECELPEGYPMVIFVRMNPAGAEHSWDSKWNQTSNLTIPTDGRNCYVVTNWNNYPDSGWMTI